MLDHSYRARTQAGHRTRRGYSLIYVGLIMLVAFFLVSLAVDLGRVRVGRMQLMTAADASALAGVQKLPVPDANGARADAVAVAASNTAIEGTGTATTVTLIPNTDVELGLYRKTGNVFTKLGQAEPGTYGGQVVDAQSLNACRVTANRTTARTNAVGLFFARAVGVNTVDVVARATAWLSGRHGKGFGIIGLDWVKFNGTTKTDSYNYLNGPYGGNNVNQNGGVGSNGTITLVGTVDIEGDARPGIDYYVDRTNNTTVTGWTAPLDYELIYPVDPPPGGYSPSGYSNTAIDAWLKPNLNFPKTNNDEPVIPNGTFYMTRWDSGSKNNTTINATSGNVKIYVSGNLDMNGTILTINTTGTNTVTFYITGDVGMNGQAEIRINGPDEWHKVTFFVDGDWSTNGGDIANDGAAHNLYISMTGTGSSMDISTETRAHIMAPLTDITFHGNAQNPPADFWGWVVGKTLDIKGNSELHYDESLTQPGGPLHPSLIK